MKTKHKISLFLFGVLLVGFFTLSGCKEEDPESGQVRVNTYEKVKNLTSLSADVRGATGGPVMDIIQRGIVYSTSENPTIDENSFVLAKRGNGDFSVTLTSLTPSTKYYFRAFAELETGVLYGPLKNFTTPNRVLATVTMDEVFPGATNADLAAEVVAEGEFPVTVRGFIWGQTSDLSLENGTVVECGSGLGEFFYSLTGLTENQTYYARAYATTDGGTAYSQEWEFLPKNRPLAEISQVTPGTIGLYSMTVSASVLEANGTVIRKGFCWSTTPEPEVSDNSISVENDFQGEITGLRPLTTYYVRAYAVNDGGTGYGPEITVKTITFTSDPEAYDLVLVTPLQPAWCGWLGKNDGSKNVNQNVGRTEVTPGNDPMNPAKAILDPFYVAKYEVTNAEYAEFLNHFGATQVDDNGTMQDMFDPNIMEITQVNGVWTPKTGRERYPVVGVSWYGANAYCEFYGGFLPSEMEWECAARGNRYPESLTPGSGYTEDDLTKYSGSNDIAEVAVQGALAEVGTKKANQIGLYDMSGNVLEWCRGFFGTYTDPYTLPTSGHRPCRGGTYSSTTANHFRCVNRMSNETYGDMSADIGFRFFIAAQ